MARIPLPTPDSMNAEQRRVYDAIVSGPRGTLVGPLRAAFLATFAPYAKDVVIAGHDRDVIGVLVFPDLDMCRACALIEGPAAAAAILHHPSVRAKFAELLAGFSRLAKGSSTRIESLVLLEDPPSIDLNEITDKGSINQRAVLTHRNADVERMYLGRDRDVIVPRSH